MSIGNFWSESFGQIYPSLASLRKQGLVEVEETGRDGAEGVFVDGSWKRSAGCVARRDAGDAQAA